MKPKRLDRGTKQTNSQSAFNPLTSAGSAHPAARPTRSAIRSMETATSVPLEYILGALLVLAANACLAALILIIYHFKCIDNNHY